MPFKKKAVVKVGTKDWEVLVPRPPNHATHARLVLHDEYDEKGRPKMATLPIQDFGCFKGVSGDFYYLRMDNKRKIIKEWNKDSWYWNGYEVDGIDELMQQN
tara:strand:+ start:2974 stop:3279 length:306 start_codon:yes stop_codon:yes gene_type:complete